MRILNKLYVGISVFLLISILLVGFWTLSIDGVPEIGLQNLQRGEYAAMFHEAMAESLSENKSLTAWNTMLNRFYSFTGLSQKEEVQMLIPIVNDGADHGAQLPEIATPTETAEEEHIPTTTESAVAETASTTTESSEATETSTDNEIPTQEETTAHAETPTEEEPPAEALGQILLMGDRAMELPEANYEAIEQYSASVRSIANALEDVSIYSILVPNSAGLYAPETYQQGQDNQKNMIDYAYNSMGEGICSVDAYEVLQEHKEEYLYFRTDHHWTHLGSYYAYTAFCEAAGLTACPLSLYESGNYETFLGTMYSFLSGYSQREILRENPDSLTYYIPYRNTTVRYYDSESMAYGGKIDMVYSLSENYSNKYICFLGGDHPITVIETDQPEERVCLLIKESYGNAFATWLTGHYSKIICIDPREFNRNGKPSLDLQAFAEKQGVDDCIILNYPLMINSTAYAAWLGRLVP